MPNFHVISRERHGTKGWRRRSGFGFTASDTIAPVVGAELPRAMMHFPIALLAQGDNYAPYVLLGITPGKNLILAQDNSWITPYVPAVYRGYPFHLATMEDGQQVLCFDEMSDQLTEAAEGTAFFTPEGGPTEDVSRVLNFLIDLDRSRIRTERAVRALAEKGLIVPWEAIVETKAGRQELSGLFKVDETALNALPAADFEDLRQAGALPLAFCQMLSMQHLQTLASFSDARAEAEAKMAAAVQPLIEMPTTDNDSIDWSRFGI